VLVTAHLLVQLSRLASTTGHDPHKECDLRQFCHYVRQTPDAVSILFVRRLREKERKQAEKEARAVRKTAAGGAKNTLDSFINRVTYKVDVLAGGFQPVCAMQPDGTRWPAG
jgi:hypothetical protein